MSQIIVVNDYAYRIDRAAFAAAAAALTRRVESEGHPGLRSYRFVAGESGGGALIEYQDAAAWFGHHEISFPWPEMAGLHAAAQLTRITFMGDAPQSIRDWLAASPLTAEVRVLDREVGGFVRPLP